MRDVTDLPFVGSLLQPVQNIVDHMTGRASSIKRVAMQPILEAELAGIVKNFKLNEIDILNDVYQAKRTNVLTHITEQCIKIHHNNPNYAVRDRALDRDVADIANALIASERDQTLQSEKFMIVAAVCPRLTAAYRENAEKFDDFNAENLALVDNLTPLDIACQPVASKGGLYYFGPRLGLDPERTWRYPVAKRHGGPIEYYIEDYSGNAAEVLKKFDQALAIDQCADPVESDTLIKLRGMMHRFTSVSEYYFTAPADDRPTFF